MHRVCRVGSLNRFDPAKKRVERMGLARERRWGGERDRRHGKRWEANTLVPAFSTTKGMSTPAMAVTHSRGLFELDRPVALYWPDFARHEETGVAARQPLAHQAGLAVVETNEPEAGVTAGFDEVLRLDSAFTMAFMKPFPILSLGTPARAYVHTAWAAHSASPTFVQIGSRRSRRGSAALPMWRAGRLARC